LLWRGQRHGGAEEKGFEPLVPFGTAVFKTAAFDHSATPPGICSGGEIFTTEERESSCARSRDAVEPSQSARPSTSISRRSPCIGSDKARHLPHAPPQLCDASPRSWVRHPHDPRATRAPRCGHHHGLYARSQPRPVRRP